MTVGYLTVVVFAPIAVVAGDRLARRGDRNADAVAQVGLGLIFGIWALPSSSGLVALLSLAAGIWAPIHSSNNRWYGMLALLGGIAGGIGLLALSLRPVGGS